MSRFFGGSPRKGRLRSEKGRGGIQKRKLLREANQPGAGELSVRWNQGTEKISESGRGALGSLSQLGQSLVDRALVAGSGIFVDSAGFHRFVDGGNELA